MKDVKIFIYIIISYGQLFVLVFYVICYFVSNWNILLKGNLITITVMQVYSYTILCFDLYIYLIYFLLYIYQSITYATVASYKRFLNNYIFFLVLKLFSKF